MQSSFALDVARGVEVGRRYHLAEGACGIGRSPKSAVVMHGSERAVSAHHAILYVHDGALALQDLQSTNGTYVNEERIEGQRELAPGDSIGFGRTGARLTLVDCAAEAPRTAAAPEEQNAAPAPLSLTQDLEARFSGGDLGATAMHDLLRNRKRVHRMLDSTTLEESRKRTLAGMLRAYRRSRGRYLAIAGAAGVAAVVLSGLFALKARQYRAQLVQARQLDAQLDAYEERIVLARESARGDSTELRRLLSEFDQQNQRFGELRSHLELEDFAEVYSDPLELSLEKILRAFGETQYHIPPAMLERVRHHVAIYSGRMRATIAAYRRRADTYRPMVACTLREMHIPEQLICLAMLESGMDPLALSHAGARGLWQFMPATARQYRLRVEGSVDERTDPAKSTRAAAEYLRDLIGIFGGRSSVMLALAAYNAGEGRVMGALKRIDDPMRDRDFWHVYRMGYLAEETNEYIPRVLALMIIDSEPRRYGFEARGGRAAE